MPFDFTAALGHGPGGDPLAAFDSATGATHVEAAWYVATITRGELVTTRAGKLAFRLSFDLAEGRHAGFRLWRYLMLDSPAAANRSKAVLTPLGLRSSADLRNPYPAHGQVVRVRVLVGVQERADGTISNDVLRFEVLTDEPALPNPNLIDPTDFTPKEVHS